MVNMKEIGAVNTIPQHSTVSPRAARVEEEQRVLVRFATAQPAITPLTQNLASTPTMEKLMLMEMAVSGIQLVGAVGTIQHPSTACQCAVYAGVVIEVCRYSNLGQRLRLNQSS